MRVVGVMAIIADIQEFNSSFSSFDIAPVKRQANLVTHFCAKEALTG